MKEGMRSAALIQFGSKYASMACQLVITAILARLLSPEDFGLLAIVSVFTAFFALFSDMGIGVAVIQFRELDEKDFGALFFLSGVLGVGLAALFCAASPLFAIFYSEPTLVPLCCAASPSIAFATLNMVPNGLMLRERKFGAVGVRLVVATVASGLVAVFAAFAGAGVYALVLQLVFSAAVVLVWNLLTRPIHGVNIHFAQPLRIIFPYSIHQFGFSFINYFSRNLDRMLVGKMFGAVDVGNYDKAYKLTGYPLSAFSSVIASVIQPFMAEHQDDREYVFSYWLKIEKALSLAGVAITVVFLSAPTEIVELFYGLQWGNAAPVFAALSFSVYFQVVWNPSGAFFQSLGRTDLMFRAGLVNTLLTIIGLLAGLMGGSIFTVGVGVSAAYCLHTVTQTWYLLHRCFGVGPGKLLVFFPEILTGVVAFAICALMSPLFPESSLLASFACKLLVIGTVLLIGFKLTGQLGYLRTLIQR